jgi:gluconokinase
LFYLKADEEFVRRRVLARTHRYMPAALLDSQFETLEEPEADEHTVVIPVEDRVADTVLAVLRRLA